MGKLLNDFINLFFEEEEVLIKEEEKEEIIIKKETVPVVETTTEKPIETKKTTYINIDEDFQGAKAETTEKIKVDQSAFIQNDKKINYVKTKPNRAVEYEFTPVLSPIFGVVSNDRKKIKVYPDSRKTELLQPKESILGAGIRPYAGIIDSESDAITIPFALKNGNRREEEIHIEKIDISDIVQAKTRMSRHVPEDEKMVFTENGEVIDVTAKEERIFSVPNIAQEVSIPIPETKEEIHYAPPEIEEKDVIPTPIVEEIKVPAPIIEEVELVTSTPVVEEQFDESTIIVKEKPFFFQKEEDSTVNHKNTMQDIDEEETLSFEEEDINLFNME